MLAIFKKTEFMEFKNYKKIIDGMDDVYFMNYVAKRNM